MLKSLTQLVLILNKAGEFLKLANALHMSLSQFVAHMVGVPAPAPIAAPAPVVVPPLSPNMPAPIVVDVASPAPVAGSAAGPPNEVQMWGPTIPADNE